MDLPSLKVLRAVHQHGGVRPAARALGLAASTVSQQLKSLSEQLGFPLTRIDSGKLALTPAGASLALLAAGMSVELERSVDEFRAAHQYGATTTIRVGAFSSAQEFCVIGAAKRMHDVTPFRIGLVTIGTEEAPAHVAQGRLDAALSLGEMVERRSTWHLAVYPLWRERFTLLLPPRLRRLTRERDPERLLAQVPWVLPPADSICDRITAQLFRRLGIAPRPIGRTDDWNVMQRMALELEAAALVPVTTQTIPPDGGLQTMPINPALLPWRTVVLCAAPGEPTWLASLREALRATARQAAAHLDDGITLLGDRTRGAGDPTPR